MLYIFNSKDEFMNIINEETGLLSTEFKDYQNELLDYPFTFFVDSESEHLPLIEKENQVAFYDRDNRLRLMRIKEISERSSMDGYVVEAKCEPSYLELYDHFIEDKRVNNGTAQTALDRALAGSRYTGEVTAELGNNTTNFYWINAVEAVFNIIEVWGGALLDTITLDNNNEIIERKIIIKERLGADNGLLIEPDYNAESIERKTLSYPITAMYAQGSSLEIEDDEGNHTGGYTRYITFEDVEWSKAKGDPVDKPKGQKWVGDPEALEKYGYVKSDGSRLHRFGHFSDQDYETPEELLQATWEALQQAKHPEISHEATINVDRKVSLGDTATIIDRNYNKPIELQSQITGLEYDILAPNDDVKVVIGKYIDMSRDPLEKELEEVKKEVAKPRPTKPITNDSFPDIKPATPTNVTATGVFRAVLINWEYDSSVYVSEYEVYASQVKDFVPDSQHLVYRGRVSAFGHEVGSQETWYYRVRSVNTRGTASDFSEEVTANSIRIDFIDLEDEIKQEIDDAKDRADEAYDNANNASQNAMDAIDKAQQGFDKAQDAITQAGTANTKADQSLSQAQSAFNKAQEALDDLDTIHEFVDDTTGELTTIKGSVQGLQSSVSSKVDQSTYNTFVQQTNNSIAGKISMSDAEGVFVKGTTFTATVDGLQSQVNSKASQSSVTQLDGEIDLRVKEGIDNIKLGTRNLLGRYNSEDTLLENISHGKSGFGYSLRRDSKGFFVELDEGKEYTVSFVAHTNVPQDITTSIDKLYKEYSITTEPKKYTWTFTAPQKDKVDTSITPTEAKKWTRHYMNSPMLVKDNTLPIYANNNLPNPPVGGVFNNAHPHRGYIVGDNGIDSPATAYAGIVMAEMFRITGEQVYKTRAIEIANYFLKWSFDAFMWETPFKAFPNAVIYDSSSNTWKRSTRFIHLRTFYHVAWALLEVYDITNDTRYSKLSGELLDSATMFQSMVEGQVDSNELASYMKGAVFNTINSGDGINFEPDYLSFNNTTGDVIYKAIEKYIELFGDSKRVYFDLYNWEEVSYNLSGCRDKYFNHLRTLYDSHGLRASTGHKMLYCFTRYEWEDTPDDKGAYYPQPTNWDFINDVWGKDQWFTGDLQYWAITGFALAGHTDIVKPLLDRYYELRTPDAEGRLLFYDRYDAYGNPMPDDQSKSTTFTALYMQARHALDDYTYDAECMRTLEYYQINSDNSLIDGSFSWDAVDDSSFIENKSLGEIALTVLTTETQINGSSLLFANSSINEAIVTDMQLEEGNMFTDWTPSPEDVDQKFSAINQTVNSIASRVQTNANNYSSISQTVQGLQTEVNRRVDATTYNSKMTQLDNAIQARITTDTADGRYATKTALTLTETSLTTEISKKVDTTTYTSKINQIDTAINLRVQKGDVINQINLDKSGVLISGKNLILDGDTTVTGNFRVRDANIASIEAGKITGGTADFAKFTAINMRGLDIYGSRFRSSAGTDSMEITGGNIQLSLNNGRRLDISPTGFYGYNAGGSVRFQADSSLVTSAALGTSNYNVYLAAEDSGSRLGEVRAVKISTLGGSGNSTDYEYIDIRARSIKSAYGRHFYIATDLGELRVMSQGLATQGVYRDVRMNKAFANEYEVNTGNILYLRTNDRVRIMRKGSSESYSDLQTGKIQAHSVRNNTETSGSHFYIGTGSTSTSELRVTTNGLWGGSHDDTVYTQVRASGYFGNTLDQHSGVGGSHIYVRPSSGGELRVTRTGTTGTYQAVRASAFNESSSRDYKTDIQPYEDSALDIINQLSVVNFRFKDDVENDIDDLKIGFIAEDSEPIASLDGKAIQTYKLGAYNTKAIQELHEQLNTQQQIIDSLMVKVAEMEREK